MDTQQPPEPMAIPAAVVKAGRNDPCPCGSGKKFKKCCADKPEFNTVTTAPLEAARATSKLPPPPAQGFAKPQQSFRTGNATQANRNTISRRRV